MCLITWSPNLRHFDSNEALLACIFRSKEICFIENQFQIRVQRILKFYRKNFYAWAPVRFWVSSKMRRVAPNTRHWGRSLDTSLTWGRKKLWCQYSTTRYVQIGPPPIDTLDKYKYRLHIPAHTAPAVLPLHSSLQIQVLVFHSNRYFYM